MTERSSPPGPRSIARLAQRIARPAFRRRGFAQGDALTRWPEIVGETLARVSCPEKLSFPEKDGPATLQVRVAPGFAVEIQHLTPLVLERINTFYGYRAVGRLRLVQAPLPARKAPRQATDEIGAAEQARLEETTGQVADAALRQALIALGRGIVGRRRSGGRSQESCG